MKWLVFSFLVNRDFIRSRESNRDFSEYFLVKWEHGKCLKTAILVVSSIIFVGRDRTPCSCSGFSLLRAEQEADGSRLCLEVIYKYYNTYVSSCHEIIFFLVKREISRFYFPWILKQDQFVFRETWSWPPLPEFLKDRYHCVDCMLPHVTQNIKQTLKFTLHGVSALAKSGL